MQSLNGWKPRLVARYAALLVVGFGFVAPAFSDPPSQAPAHGWRKKHDPYYVGYTGHRWPNDYGIIDGGCNREAIGAVLGGVAGGAIGSQVGDGDGRVVAIVLGTVLGAMIGREIGRDLDDRDRACVGHTLELAKDGQSVRWLNSTSGVSYVLTPLAGSRQGGNCRSFTLQASRDGRSQSQQTSACRAADGTWQMKG